MPTGITHPVTKEKAANIPDALRKAEELSEETNGFPKGISTEPQLWDEVFKKEVFEMPFLLFPLITEIHGISYPADTKVTPFGTEYSVERVITKSISSIRSDISVWIRSRIFHFECEIDTEADITKRVYEYDSQAALTYAIRGSERIPYLLRFPYSAVLFLAPDAIVADHLACELRMQVYNTNPQVRTKTHEKCIEYAIPALKVQSYSLQEIREKRLLILIPFTPIRFRATLLSHKRKKEQMEEDNNNHDSAKLELTNYFHEIILILDEAVETGYISECNRKDILAMLRKAMIRVFHNDEYLLEVVNHMTAPILELERETIVRQNKELAEKNSKLAKKNSELAEKNSELAEMYTKLEKKDAEIQRLLSIIEEGGKSHDSTYIRT
ncbi:MAG: vacuolar protein sorting family 37 protein [Lachnospiraceae bacterium]|nr:vacuolar protein sorting family 37 protein [Lachnospiraceae bacterium]